MNIEREKRKGPSFTSLVVFAMIVLAYLLSPGPFWRYGPSFLSEDQLESTATVVFAPIGWCYENAEPVESFYEWYFSLWGV